MCPAATVADDFRPLKPVLRPPTRGFAWQRIGARTLGALPFLERSMSFAYMPFYTGDYYRDTRHLSMMQHGAYRLLLDHCWDQRGPLPLDIERCYRICGAVSKEEQETVRGIREEFFIRMEDGWYNKRLQRELERCEAISSGRADAGRKGGLAKAKQLLSSRQARAKQMPLSPSPSPSSTPAPAPAPDPAPDPAQPSAASGGAPPGPPMSPPATPTETSSGPVAQKRATRPAPTAEVWAAYASAYEERYGVPPVRNAKINGMLSQFLSRLGSDEAVGVARFYITSRNGLYVSSKHCVDLMLRDAEKLHTEWRTGNTGYQRDAQEQDKLASTGAMWERVGKRLAEKGIT